MKLIPYLNFNGNCEEAMDFYARVLKGTFTVDARMDSEKMHLPAECNGKIMHSMLTFAGNTVYASDGSMFEDGGRIGDNRRAVMSISVNDAAQGESIFTSLAEGGKVYIPFALQPWDDYYGQAVDKYGISWAINTER